MSIDASGVRSNPTEGSKNGRSWGLHARDLERSTSITAKQHKQTVYLFQSILREGEGK